MLKHADFQSDGEALRGDVEVVENYFAPPPPHEVDCVRIQEESHGHSCAEEVGADVGGREPDGWARLCDDCADGGSDLGAADLCPCTGVLGTCNGGVTGRAVALKVYHTAKHFRH